ncbi:putative late blight resistance protein homolog R1B-17 [Sesamum indicum]|uniref:Late blight resistance protein homolog R1B-17 n=1 Tax=Sesamum indicum TaxID=4182 RepID=A0A8M8UZ42_SESIN|nr:putative late blight resistance protein homolog R1B-17 [Sesamum indicum]
MAYNLESLVKILEQILHPDHHKPIWILDPDKKPMIESLLEKARSLRNFFENSSSAVTVDGIRDLESFVGAAAQDAEDILESHLTDQILSAPGGKGFTLSPPNLSELNTRLDSAVEEMRKIMSRIRMAKQDQDPKNVVVGITEDVNKLRDWLTNLQDTGARKVVPIVGMGGIGKSTLARHLYDDSFIISHFDTRAWSTVSQNYNVHKILLDLLGCVTGKPTDEMLGEEDDQLGLRLHQNLKRRRYLIVLDDIWNIEPWEHIARRYFPDDGNGSRIIVTTRESKVADDTGSGSPHHLMNLLKDDESWKLLHQKVFATQETCTPELEDVGRRIANNCRGLPLAINVIGGLLSQAKRSPESWEQIAKDVSSVVADKEQFSNILSLSYNNLPYHLKPCFLYMGAFPENYEIRASRLIKLWVSEGFLKPVSDTSPEEAAQIYLKALVDRNLIFVHRQEPKGNAKSYSLHDLLRDLCVRKAHEEKFLLVKAPDGLPSDTLQLRRMSTRDPNISAKQMQYARSFLFTGAASREILSDVVSEFRLLRVLDILGIKSDQFPEEILQLVNLRYLALSSAETLPSSISRLRILQTLIVQAIASSSWPCAITPAILDMTQLRHIKFKGTYVRYHDKIRTRSVVQKNLISLSTIAISQLSHKFLETVGNMKELGIICGCPSSPERDLTLPHKLEKLKCSSTDLSYTQVFLSCLIFPSTLKKLTVSGCIIMDGHMNKIGELPNLEVLKLRKDHFDSSMWEPSEGGFSRLRFLLLEDLDLVNWIADYSHFPRLEHLVIRGCSDLEEIPPGIGEITTLEIIEVQRSSASAVASALKIQEEQADYGVQVRFGPSH